MADLRVLIPDSRFFRPHFRSRRHSVVLSSFPIVGVDVIWEGVASAAFFCGVPATQGNEVRADGIEGGAAADCQPCVPITVLIPTHDRPALLRRTLDSLAAAELPAGYAETIVVENGGRGGAEEVVESAAKRLRARYVYSPPANKSRALDRGLAEIADALVFMTDDDVRFDPLILLHYAQAARRHRRSYFGGPFDVDYEIPPPGWLKGFLPLSLVPWRPAAAVTPSEFYGCNWGAFASDLRAAGRFDASRGPGTEETGQETEMQRRLLAGGCTAVYLPGATVWHYASAEHCTPEWLLARAARQARGVGRNLASRRWSPVRRLWWRLHPRTAGAKLWATVCRSEAARFRARYWSACRTGCLSAVASKSSEPEPRGSHAPREAASSRGA